MQMAWLVRRYANSSFSKVFGLNSSNKISIDNFLFCQQIFYFVKINCCLFDQSFLHSFDGKYRSETALLVDHFSQKPNPSGLF